MLCTVALSSVDPNSAKFERDKFYKFSICRFSFLLSLSLPCSSAIRKTRNGAHGKQTKNSSKLEYKRILALLATILLSVV